MKKMTAFALACAAGLTVQTWAAGGGDDRDLINQAAADRNPAAAAPAAQRQADAAAAAPALRSDDLDAAEAHARSDAALSQARLELVLARKALKSGDSAGADRRARSALALLAPVQGDVSVWELQAEGIIARATRTAANVALSDAPQDAATAPAAASSARSPAEAPPAYTASAVEPNEALLRDQKQQYEAYSTDEARRLIEVNDARIAPRGEVAYPADWKERVARRSKWAGGEVARSKSWTDKDGREWYAAIYDIRDVTYVVPDFQAPNLGFAENERNRLDRDALRQRSFIFGGTDEELAAGIPLLRFFGGVDDFAYRGPKYSREKQAEIIDQIKAFTTQQTEAAVIPLGN